MEDRDKKIIRRICEHIDAVKDYCKNVKDSEAFMKNKMLMEASIFNIMQIGELIKEELSEETKKSVTSIPWQQIYGLRNRIVHGYSSVKPEMVWGIITEDLPNLKKELEELIG